MIGNPGFGLGVEARKRVTIGVELASKPQLLVSSRRRLITTIRSDALPPQLFLDEPTSGLDSQSAFNIVRFLRKLASAGQAILVTVHQPDSFLFEHFDRLLLLTSSRGGQGGKCVYFGEIGKDSNVLRSYLAKHGALCPEDANPAECTSPPVSPCRPVLTIDCRHARGHRCGFTSSDRQPRLVGTLDRVRGAHPGQARDRGA
jgi:ATP-binding cassette subfamily G (WHITE) protein 2 (SNQ2)